MTHNKCGQLPLKIAAGQPKRCAFLPAPAAGRYGATTKRI